MNELELLKQHHQEFLEMIDEVRLLINGETSKARADEAMELISRLNGQLMVHLTMEDRHVYPAMMISNNAEVRELATRFKSQIGGLFVAFQAYRIKWSHSEQVVDDPVAFSADTEEIFSILNKRMALEDEILYPKAPSLQIS